MDNLFINQTEIYEAIKQLLANIKKAGAERKTYDFCKRKNDLLETYWSTYLDNHRKISKLAEPDHVYNTKGCYETAEEVYLAAKSFLKKTIEQLEQKTSISQQGSLRVPEAEANRPGTSTRPTTPQSSTPQPVGRSLATTGNTSKLEELIRKQKINMRAFMRTLGGIKTDELEKKWEFEDALKSLEARWSAIDKLHWEIEGENGCEDSQYQEDFTDYESIFIQTKKAINTKMWSVSHREKSTPQIDIPIFNGNYKGWVSFKDLFTEAIHNNPSMTNAQKMQFLKSKVTGEAERLIHHLPISSENYEACWELLNHRYGNKKLIFTSHINILLGLPTMQMQSYAMIQKLHDVTKECLHGIQNLGIDIATWDPLLVHLLAQKLENTSFTEYLESVKKPRDLPSLQEFLGFLETKFTALEAARRKNDPSNQKTNHQNAPSGSNHKSNQKGQNNRSFNESKNKSNLNAFHASRSTSCGVCNLDHRTWHCQQFIASTPEQRLQKIYKLNYCQNCFINHFNEECSSTKRCRKCLGAHNTLLHDALTKQSSPSQSRPTSKPTNKENEQVLGSSHASWEDTTEILLATAMVHITGVDGTRHTMRILVDGGSQVSLIDERAAQILGLKRKQCKGTIFGVGKNQNNAKGIINIDVHSLYDQFSFNTDVIIMNSLILNLPNRTLPKPTWAHIQNISLADPEFNISRPVDLLFGADIYSKIVLGGILKGDSDEQPIAQQTKLGWLLCGTVRPHYNCNVVLHNTDDLLKFWEHEDINQINNQEEMSSDDQECLQYFLDTTTRLENGRYQVRLPFKPELKNKLGATKPQALAQFRNMERKLEKNSQLKTDYQKFMYEYLELNHMKPAISNHNQPSECYLPHHGVIRAESTTTKLRVVFNASAKSSTGLSLNDVMYRGPNLQQDLQRRILKWRQYQFVYTADIEKMYRQILVHKDDQAFQRIYWRFSPDEKIQTFQLTTLTYGTKPAGWLAMMCLKKLATDERINFSEAARELEENFYMDDYCGGSHSIAKANQLKADLIQLLNTAGLNLRKWSSNKKELLSGLEIDQCNQPTYEFKQTDSTKTLGLGWNPQMDIFIFESKIEPKPSSEATKRSLLSDISKLFDPLGWLTPVSTTMKILFQKVWLEKLDWDEKLPKGIDTEWIKLRQELSLIKTIKINRWLGIEENETIELHGFSDASNLAYSCVIYCKVIKNNKTTVTLVAAKARLSPLNKILTTPRLELMGSLLLTQLLEKVQSCLVDYQIEIYCWTDSTAVLGWIQGDPARWKQFVANRVKKNTNIVPAERWQYVKSNDNPADCASRGLYVQQLKDHALWWQGPPWLHTYKHQNNNQTIYQTNLEEKKSFLGQTNAIVLEQNSPTKTKNGLLKRPIVKLSILPVNQNAQNLPEIAQKQESESKEEPVTKQEPKRRRHRPKLFTIATALFSFMTLLSPALGLYSVRELPKNQTLYFDPISKLQLIRDKWTLIVYHDMKPYWTGIDAYQKISNYLDKLCATIENQSHCNIILQQAQHEFKELKYYNDLLLTQHYNIHARRRRRRGLVDGVGYLANELFGVLDSRFADQYTKDIETIQRNEKHLSSLWKNQTSVIEAEFNLMKNMELTVDKQHKLINKKLNDFQENTSILQRELQNVSYIQEFTLTAMAGNTLLQSLRRLQETLIDTITDIYHGQISMNLLTPTQLKSELQTISGQMPTDLTLPIKNINTDFQYIYKLLKVKARATKAYVIIEVTFPLIARESYQLYKLLSVPHQINTKMLKISPISEYVAVNLKRDCYFTVTNNELMECAHHGLAYLCPQRKPINKLENDDNFCTINKETNKCIIERSNCANNWVTLRSSSQHFYFCCDTYTIKIICNDQVIVRQLSGSGVIATSQECILKGNDFTLYTIRHQSNQVNITSDIYIPELDQINHIVNVKIPNYETNQEESLNSSFTSLGESIKNLKNSNTEVEEISYHNIHHYAVSYITLAGVVSAIIAWMWRSGRCCRRGPAAGRRGEGRCPQDAEAATPPPSRPRRRRGSHRQQEFAETSAPPRPTSAPPPPPPSEVISASEFNREFNRRPEGLEVLSANRLNKRSEIGFQLNSYTNRWPERAPRRSRTDRELDNNGFEEETIF